MWMAANVSLCRRMKKGKQENAGAALGSLCVYCLRSVDCRTFILKSKGIESAEKFLLERLTEVAPPGCLLPEHCRLNEMVSTPGRIIKS